MRVRSCTIKNHVYYGPYTRQSQPWGLSRVSLWTGLEGPGWPGHWSSGLHPGPGPPFEQPNSPLPAHLSVRNKGLYKRKEEALIPGVQTSRFLYSRARPWELVTLLGSLSLFIRSSEAS